jgi:predicted transcriptional regulator
MNIETTKLELMHLLLQTQKESLLSKLKQVFEDERTDWWLEMTEEEQAEIEEGLEQSKKGQVISNQEVKQVFSKWH